MFSIIRLFLVFNLILSSTFSVGCRKVKKTNRALQGTWYCIGDFSEGLSTSYFDFFEEDKCSAICGINEGGDRICDLASFSYSIEIKNDSMFLNVDGNCKYCNEYFIEIGSKRDPDMLLSDTLTLRNEKYTFQMVKYFTSDYQKDNWRRFWRENIK